MFSLRDFFHLPQLDDWVEQLAGGGPGLAIVAGLDVRPGMGKAGEPAPAGGLLPSGRSAIFSVLIDQVLIQLPQAGCLVVAQDEHAVRIPRQFRRRMRVLSVEPPFSYAGQIEAAIERHPALLVIDRLDGETAGLALSAAGRGLFVLAPLDTVFHGSEVARHLLSLGVTADQSAALRWVISVQRLPTLCPKCKQPAQPDEEQSSRLRSYAARYSGQSGFEDLATALSKPEALQVFQAMGCVHCRYSGRQGEATVFDVFYNPAIAGVHPAQTGAHTPKRAGPDQADDPAQVIARPSVLPMEAYVGRLALLGHLPLEDFLDFDAQQFRRFGHTLLARDAALAETMAAHERKLAELEAANRVLQQRTRSLVSLQEIGQALITSEDIHDLSERVCRFAQSLCGADRVIIYYLHSDKDAETLAVGGWESERVPLHCNPSAVFSADSVRLRESSGEPAAYNRWPPGIPPRHPDVEGAALRAGLYVPLVAQEKRVGFILAHTTRQPAFSPKETSLLQTLAQQAALGIQRARLVDDLRSKIDQLQAAQEELAKKERLEHELELARQVQQSMLPRAFADVPGFRFAARNRPARQVGGDFYDVIQLDGERFGVAIADVSDKGLPAALYMALTRSLLRAEARRQPSPLAVLSNVNQLLLELGDGESFVTVFYGVVDRASNRMAYSRAGHDRPLLLRAGQAQPLGGDGTPLGILNNNFRLTEEEILLAPGDRLVLYTDGLTDVTDPDGALFDLERLAALLETFATQPLESMCEALFASLLEFQGEAEQYDDMSLLVVEVV
jgi:serine phosphatase RsbU (regulator of sigma subunit)